MPVLTSKGLKHTYNIQVVKNTWAIELTPKSLLWHNEDFYQCGG